MADDRKKASSAGRELGRLGAKKGGRARARSLTPAERSEIARRAVRARWAKSGKVGTAPVDTAARDEVPRSVFRGPLTVGDIGFEAHVLDDGRRVLGRDHVVEAFAGDTGPDGLERVLDKLPGYARRPLDLTTVPYRVPGRAGTSVGFETATVATVADRFLSARAAGPLKKQPARAAAAAEAIVRAAATAGLNGLVDDATGYAKVRARQAAQRDLLAFIAEDIGSWASRFPKDFWGELARLEGTPAKQRSVGWARYVLLFVYDAIDPDVGRELRRDPGQPPFRPSIPRWLHEVGRTRVDERMDAVVTGVRGCADMEEFSARFAKVLHKGPSHSQLPEGVD
jgi:P63C domain